MIFEVGLYGETNKDIGRNDCARFERKRSQGRNVENVCRGIWMQSRAHEERLGNKEGWRVDQTTENISFPAENVHLYFGQ